MSIPKYVQRELDRLAANVAYWKEKALAGPENSNTFVWGGGIGGDNDKPLGTNPQIEFDLGKDRYFHEKFTAQLRDRELWVSGGDGLVIAPYSSNYVRLRIAR